MTGTINADNPRTPEEYLREADQLDEHGRTIEAAALLREMTQRWPERADGWSQLAAMLVLAGDHYADALDVAERALAINPNDICALVHGGHAARLLGKLDLAKMFYQRLIAIAPSAHRILYLARAHALLHEDEDAATRAVEGIAQMDDQTPRREQRLQMTIELLAGCEHLSADFPPELAAIVRATRALTSHRRSDAHRELHSVVSDAHASPAAKTTAHTLLGELWRAKRP